MHRDYKNISNRRDKVVNLSQDINKHLKNNNIEEIANLIDYKELGKNDINYIFKTNLDVINSKFTSNPNIILDFLNIILKDKQNKIYDNSIIDLKEENEINDGTLITRLDTMDIDYKESILTQSLRLNNMEIFNKLTPYLQGEKLNDILASTEDSFLFKNIHLIKINIDFVCEIVANNKYQFLKSIIPNMTTDFKNKLICVLLEKPTTNYEKTIKPIVDSFSSIDEVVIPRKKIGIYIRTATNNYNLIERHSEYVTNKKQKVNLNNELKEIIDSKKESKGRKM